MMVALLLYGYAVGERSSRRLERRCVEDVATRVICANQAPDHTTIARFRQRHERALAELFGEVLALCAEAGLVRVGVIAVDGTKVAANAAPQATRDYEQIAREILAEADAVDAEEDERFGDARGDELPRELATAQGRRGWLREAKRRLDEQRAEEARPIPRDRPDRLREAKRRLEEEHRVECQANAAYEAYRARGVDKNGKKFGRPPKPFAAAGGRRRARSTSATWTRATSRPRAAGCRATTPRRSRPRIRSSSPPRSPSTRPTSGTSSRWSRAARDELATGRRRAAARRRARRRRLLAPGPDGTPARRRPDGAHPARRQETQRAPAPAGTAASTRSCAASLTPTLGGELYAKRQTMIEPVFADTKFNRRIDRFLRRGRSAARSEWRLTNAAHNLLKLWRHTTAPAAA